MRNILILLTILLVACGGTETAASIPKAETISCTAAYRAAVDQGVEREETISFDDVTGEQSILFAEMTFNAAYSAGEVNNERNLRVWVTDSADETAVYHSNLYQFNIDSGPQNQFIGGHGFTGLNYRHVPNSDAELQFWCEVN